MKTILQGYIVESKSFIAFFINLHHEAKSVFLVTCADLSSSYTDKYIIAWRKIERRIWKIPINRHKHIVHNLSSDRNSIVWYCIMRSYTVCRLERYRIGIPRELSEIRTEPWFSEGSLTCDPCHHRGPIY